MNVAQSGITEIGYIITGQAAVFDHQAGCQVRSGTAHAHPRPQRLVILLETEFGAIELQIVLKLADSAAGARARSV
jgi:hypothetical protein